MRKVLLFFVLFLAVTAARAQYRASWSEKDGAARQYGESVHVFTDERSRALWTHVYEARGWSAAKVIEFFRLTGLVDELEEVYPNTLQGVIAHGLNWRGMGYRKFEIPRPIRQSDIQGKVVIQGRDGVYHICVYLLAPSRHAGYLNAAHKPTCLLKKRRARAIKAVPYNGAPVVRLLTDLFDVDHLTAMDEDWDNR